MNKYSIQKMVCPKCAGDLCFGPPVSKEDLSEIEEGSIVCTRGHSFPIVRGVPRMLSEGFDARTQANFNLEWDLHEIGSATWGIELHERVDWYFVMPFKTPVEEFRGKTLLDAGCGNGSQSVAYSKLGLEVFAVDLGTGLEKGQAFRKTYEGAVPEKVNFIQADLRKPPLKPGTVDIIHSAGVLHHTPDTHATFLALLPLLKPQAMFYVWLYKYEPWVTPTVNFMRAITTRIPAPLFRWVAEIMAWPFIFFCWAVNRLGIRRYRPFSHKESSLALMDIFGAPYAHYHTYEEVEDWFRQAGFQEIWPFNEDRRGFGVCGKRT